MGTDYVSTTITITEEAIKALAASKGDYSQEVIDLLLDGRASVQLTQGIQEIITGSFDETLVHLILDREARRSQQER